MAMNQIKQNKKNDCKSVRIWPSKEKSVLTLLNILFKYLRKLYPIHSNINAYVRIAKYNTMELFNYF